MITQEFVEKGIVERFPGKGGWYYIKLPAFYKNLTRGMVIGRGFVKIRAKVGSTTWDTSLLPFGKGLLFIALKIEVRKSEFISEGDEIEISFSIL